MALFGFGGKKDKGKSDRKKRASGRQQKRASSQKMPGNGRGSKRVLKKPSSSSVRTRKPKPQAEAPVKPRKRGGLGTPEAPPDSRDRKKRTSPPAKQLGTLLIKANKINDDQLEKALNIQREKGGLLGQILIDLDYCSQGDIGGVLRKQRTITTVDLSHMTIDPEAYGTLPRDFCEKNRLIAFEKVGTQLCIAMSNALDAQAKRDIKEMVQMQTKIFDAPWTDIKAAIDKHMKDEAGAPKKTIAQTAAEEEAEAQKEEIENIVIELPEEEIVEIEEEAPATGPAPAKKAEAKPAPKPAAKPKPPAPEPDEDVVEVDLSETVVQAPSSRAPAPVEEEVIEIDPEPVDAEAVEEIEDLEEIEEVEAAEPADEVIEIDEEPEVIEIEADETAEEPKHTFHSVPTAEELDRYVVSHHPLRAIPLEREYCEAVMRGGVIDTEKRWLTEHLAEMPVPAELATEWLGQN